MRTSAVWSSLVFVSSLGCAGAPTPTPVEAVERPAARAAELAPDGFVAAEGSTAMDSSCETESTPSPDACDGFDADCDHRIDEQCPNVVPAAFEIALAWNAAADVDLIVSAPGADAALATGIAGCANGEEPRVERARFEVPREGTYVVSVAHRDACGVDTPVTVSVSISAGGRASAVFNRTLEAGATVEVGSARFVAP